jgi:hypothetical protein
MAKGQVTSDDLASGIKSFGGLSSLGGTSRPVRDNPFRDTRSEPVPPATIVPTTIVTAPEPAPEAPRLEVINGTDHAQPTPEAKQPAAPEPARVRKSVAPRESERRAPVAPVDVPEPAAGGREKKTEIYTERVTVLLDPDLRDGAEALAKKLQRSRSQKGERITANTVIRVALRAMLETFDPPSFGLLNTEEEIYDYLLRQRSRK